MSTAVLRDYTPADAPAVDRIALASFAQFSDQYQDWPAFAANVGAMSRLADHGQLIVAEHDGHLVGAVAYIGPGRPRQAFFDADWPIMRMLVVDPSSRGLRIGHALAQACVERGRRDHASTFALHTSPIMDVALPMYQRMGFRWLRDVAPIQGVRYAIYLKDLAER